MANDRWDYPGSNWEEEEKARAWEALPAGEKSRLIEEKRLASVHWGICQACGFRIEATGKDWPTSCPECGYGSEF